MPATGDAVNVKVALRCRPLSKKELSEGDRSIFTKDGNVARLQDPGVARAVAIPLNSGSTTSTMLTLPSYKSMRTWASPWSTRRSPALIRRSSPTDRPASGKSWSMTGSKDEQGN